jgi:hypothetical protein
VFKLRPHADPPCAFTLDNLLDMCVTDFCESKAVSSMAVVQKPGIPTPAAGNDAHTSATDRA